MLTISYLRVIIYLQGIIERRMEVREMIGFLKRRKLKKRIAEEEMLKRERQEQLLPLTEFSKCDYCTCYSLGECRSFETCVGRDKFFPNKKKIVKYSIMYDISIQDLIALITLGEK